MDAPALSDDLLHAWLALIRLSGTNPRTIAPLISAGADPRDLLKSPPAEIPGGLRAKLRRPDLERAGQDLAWLKESGNQLLPLNSPDYPDALREMVDPPLALFLRGAARLLSTPQLAIVGSRSATRGGLENARQFSRFLAEAGITITSGMALGIDSAAHQGALETGATIAVLGTGLDRVYPARHRDLAHRIAQQGLLVSEYLPGTPPLAHNFPRRNRIIAGLTMGTLVVEAALKSGSLITARLATEMGREVFAIPGSIHNPMARGCHALIREGAKLVESGEHIAEEFISLAGPSVRPPSPEAPCPRGEAEIDPEHQELLTAMDFEPVSADQLAERTHFSAAEISSMLLLLELQGHVSSEAGGLFTRLGKPHR